MMVRVMSGTPKKVRHAGSEFHQKADHQSKNRPTKKTGAKPAFRLIKYRYIMSSVWSKILSVIDESGFVPTEQLIDGASPQTLNRRAPSSDPVTLFEAVRLASGVLWVDVEASDTTFWNWVELRKSWAQLWGCLDLAASELNGQPTRSVPWAYSKVRTTADIEMLLGTAMRIEPEIEIPIPERRPEARMMVSSGKTDAAIANTFGVMSQNSGNTYASVLRISQGKFSHDEELLSSLDGLVRDNQYSRQSQDSNSLIPRQLVRAKIELAKKDERLGTFSRFISVLTQEHLKPDESNEGTLKVLLRISPERSVAVLKEVALKEGK